MPVSSAAVAWAVVRSQRAILPAPTSVTDGIGVVLARIGVFRATGGAVGEEGFSPQVLMSVAPATASAARTMWRSLVTRIGWRRGFRRGVACCQYPSRSMMRARNVRSDNLFLGTTLHSLLMCQVESFLW